MSDDDESVVDECAMSDDEDHRMNTLPNDLVRMKLMKTVNNIDYEHWSLGPILRRRKWSLPSEMMINLEASLSQNDLKTTKQDAECENEENSIIDPEDEFLFIDECALSEPWMEKPAHDQSTDYESDQNTTTGDDTFNHSFIDSLNNSLSDLQHPEITALEQFLSIQKTFEDVKEPFVEHPLNKKMVAHSESHLTAELEGEYVVQLLSMFSIG